MFGMNIKRYYTYIPYLWFIYKNNYHDLLPKGRQRLNDVLNQFVVNDLRQIIRERKSSDKKGIPRVGLEENCPPVRVRIGLELV